MVKYYTYGGVDIRFRPNIKGLGLLYYISFMTYRSSLVYSNTKDNNE